MTQKGFPHVRLRRLRSNNSIREMLSLAMPGPEKFIWPVFVTHGKGVREPIAAMPGQYRYSVDMLLEDVAQVVAMGVRGLMLFGVISDDLKSDDANYAWHDDGPVQQALLALRAKFPELLLFTDVCVCEYTEHGHCGFMTKSGIVDNDRSLKMLSKMALSHARLGAHGVAPSAMMDGQVGAIREALQKHGFDDTILMSYSTKFSSAMYGPFRDAAGSAPSHGDRKAYQADYRDLRTALRESAADEAEGADILMVKPLLFYLDIIRELRQQTNLPLAAYNVSGEYSMLIASAKAGYGDLKQLVRESIFSLKRAGSDIIISYWANQYDQFLRD